MQSSSRKSPDCSSQSTTQLLAAVLCAAGVSSLHAATGNWTGLGADSLWSTTANWSGATPPGTGGQIATFNSAGNSKTVIDLGAGVSVSNIVFDTASVSAYTIGAGAVGSQNLTLNSNVTMNSTVVTNQLFNANIILNTAGAKVYTNNSTINSLTFAGSIAANTASTPLTFTGAGTINVTGNITNGTGTVALTKAGTGTLTLSGSNNFSSLSLGNGVTNVAGGGTTTAISYTAASTLTVSAGTLTATSIASGSNSNGRVLNLNGGTFISNGNVFASGVAGVVSFNGGTLRSGNASGISIFDENNSINVGGGGATFDTTFGNITLGNNAGLGGTGKAIFKGTSGNTFTANSLALGTTTPTLGFNLSGVTANNSVAFITLSSLTETLDGDSYNIDFGGFTFNSAGAYKLISSGSIAGSFLASDFIAINSSVSSGLAANFVLDGSSLSYVVTSAIPEPSTFAGLTGLAVLGLAAIRRRSL